MIRKKFSKRRNNQKVHREEDSKPWRYCFLTLICGLILAAGFFLAARQHFTSIDYSIKNSQLKKQKAELETAQRQLLVAKEIAFSPDGVRRIAKELGFTEIAQTVQAVYPTFKTAEKPKYDKVSDSKTSISNIADDVRKEDKKADKELKIGKTKDERADTKSKKGNQN